MTTGGWGGGIKNVNKTKFTHFQSRKTPGPRQLQCLPWSSPTQRLIPNNFYSALSAPPSPNVTKAPASRRPGMLSLLWCGLLGEPCDIQYFCFPSLQSHLHLTPDICIMASLHLLSAGIQGGGWAAVCACTRSGCLFGCDGYTCLSGMCVRARTSTRHRQGLNDFRLNLAH